MVQSRTSEHPAGVREGFLTGAGVVSLVGGTRTLQGGGRGCRGTRLTETLLRLQDRRRCWLPVSRGRNAFPGRAPASGIKVDLGIHLLLDAANVRGAGARLKWPRQTQQDRCSRNQKPQP